MISRVAAVETVAMRIDLLKSPASQAFSEAARIPGEKSSNSI